MQREKPYSDVTKRDFVYAFKRFAKLFGTGDYMTLFTDRYSEVVAVLCKSSRAPCTGTR